MSRAFVFRLARVLQHRQRAEDARAREVRLAAERHVLAAAEQERVERARDAARTTLTAAAAVGLTADALRMHADGVQSLAGDACAAAALTEEEAARVEERRRELVQAARARRALELLEAKRRAVWQADRARAEQRDTDEIATTRARGRA